MKWVALWFPAGVAGAALLFVLSAPPVAVPATTARAWWEPADSVGWAAPAEVQVSRELDGRCRVVTGYTLDKIEVAQSLVKGELTLDLAVDRFRQLNGPETVAYLRSVYPDLSEAELVYRQVLRYVAGCRRADPARVAACLPVLEAEVNRRFSGNRTTDPSSRPGTPAPRVVFTFADGRRGAG
jgi:hypothetical protein